MNQVVKALHVAMLILGGFIFVLVIIPAINMMEMF